jgi:hypothetical protein
MAELDVEVGKEAVTMSEVNDAATCPLGGHGGPLINVKFFRGTRNDIIDASEIIEQAKSAVTQVKTGVTDQSPKAPESKHKPVNVQEFVAAL